MNYDSNDKSRRKFILNVGKAGFATMALTQPVFANSIKYFGNAVTVGEIMDRFISEVPGGVLNSTVDTLKAGNRDIVVTGIITTMFPTVEIIQKAIATNTNFIICHEPTYYSHTDDTAWLKNDEVYKFKSELLQKHNIAVWRNHDYIHRHLPDGVLEGVVNKLDWKTYQSKEANTIFTIPKTSLKSLMTVVKKKLGISTMRFIGDRQQLCSRILLMPGAWGGRRHIEMTGHSKPDVLICGEIAEWETAEYVRDARAKGQQLSLVVMGHADSEEAGSEYLATWLRTNFPGMKVQHVPTGNPLSFF